MGKNIFITFEGPDKSGKSTHSRLLAQFLRRKGYEVIHTREPGGVSIAESLRSILLHPKNKISPYAELFLYLAARAQHVEELIRPALKRKTENGKRTIVICERFNDATLAYQGYGRGLNLKFIENLNDLVSQGLKPDLTFLINLVPRSKRESNIPYRYRGDRIENESLSFHHRVCQGYLKLASQEPKRFRIITREKTIKQTQEKIRQITEKFIQDR